MTVDQSKSTRAFKSVLKSFGPKLCALNVKTIIMTQQREYSTIITAVFCGFLALQFVAQIESKPRAKMGSLEALTKEQVVPDVIDAPPAAGIEIIYDSGAKVEQGNELTPTQVQNMPQFRYKSEPDQLYTLAMVDPDAPSRKDPQLREILHCLIANIPGSDVGKGDVLAEYIGSGPPEGTGLHRYIFLVYHQKEGKLTSNMKIPNNSRKGRPNFTIKKFAKDNKLGEPIAANFYQAQYDSYVPKLHAQLSQA